LSGCLPVELIYFEGYKQDSYNAFEWATASEWNSAYFEVLVSQDGVIWVPISQIPSAWNSTTKLVYSTIDASPKMAINYYQLVQHDVDGNYKVYGPILIDNTDKIRHVVRVLNLLGKEAIPNESGLLLEVYDDGTAKKIIR
jgi:hypothetical protein